MSSVPKISANIGVISDTHDYFDPKLLDYFAGVDAILHAGDVSSMAVIRELEKIAPVYVASGNNDDDEVKARYPWITAVDVGGLRIALTHQFLPINLHSPIPRDEDWAEQLGVAGAKALVFGHNHEPANYWVRDVLYYNPGFAGPPRGEPVRTVGVMTICDGVPSVETYFLSDPPRAEYMSKAKRWPGERPERSG